MRKQALATCLSGLPLAVPGAESAAGATPLLSPQVVQEQQELDEVTVEGRRDRQRKPQQSFDWLARLVGEFTIDGDVYANPDRTSGDVQKAQGHALCIGFGIAPGVLCDLRVRSTDVTGEDGGEILGGVSTLDPAVMMFGFNLGAHADAIYGGRQNAAADPDSYTIAHILVDNTGVAEGGSGFRAGTDTMTSRAPGAELHHQRVLANHRADTPGPSGRENGGDEGQKRFRGANMQPVRT